MADPFVDLLAGRRVVMAAKEAGAGALFAALVRRHRPDPASVLLVEPAAAVFATELALTVTPLGADGSEAEARIAAVLDGTKPDHVLSGAAAGASIEKMLLRSASMRGCRTISVLDHYWNPWQRFAHETTAARWAYRPDRILVPHPLVAERLRRLGCPVAAEVFDHPLLMVLPQERTAAAASHAKRRLGIDPATFTVLLVSEYEFVESRLWQWDQPAEAELLNLAAALFRIAGDWTEQPALHVLVRPHPAERRDWAQLVPPQLDRTVTIAHDIEKDLVLAAADLAVGLNSMLLAEAAAAGIVSYSCYPSGRYTGPRLADYCPEIRGLSEGANFPSALGAAMRAACAGRLYPEGLERAQHA